MEKELFSTFQFENYAVNEISFYQNPEFVFKEPIDVDLKTNVEIKVSEEHQKGVVVINAKLFENAMEKNYPFSLSISISGYFHSEDPISRDGLSEFCRLNGTTTLFPFLRSVIADVTKAANTQPLILPLLNIHNLMERQTEKE